MHILYHHANLYDSSAIWRFRLAFQKCSGCSEHCVPCEAERSYWLERADWPFKMRVIGQLLSQTVMEW